jgi:outer membrane protein OmpA-like peptidoglycan-associated protein/protocatechuate 3,4-dioxygenase beta subunit
LADADVILYDGKGNVIERIKTDENGNFKFTLKPETFYRLEAKHKDFKDNTIVINSQAYDTLIVKELKLDEIPEQKIVAQTVLLKGKITDQNDKALSNADIILYDERGNVLQRVTTGEDGAYDFSLKTDSAYRLEAKKKDYLTESLSVETQASDTLIVQNLILGPVPEAEFFLLCHLKDNETRLSVTEAKVSLTDNKTGESFELYSDEKGFIRQKIEGKTNDKVSYTLSIEKDTYNSQTVAFDTVISKAGNYVLNLDMHKADKPETTVDVILEGKTTDQSNKILADADVILYDGKGNVIERIKTDENGNFKFTLKPETFYRLEAKHKDYKNNSIVINSHAYDTLIVKELKLDEIPEEKLVSLKGKAITILSGTEVTLSDKDGNIIGTVKTDENGEFSFNVKPDTDYILEGKKLNFKSSEVPIKVQSENKTVKQDIRLISEPNFILICHVTDQLSNKPLAEAKLIFYDINKGDQTIRSTDKDGIASFKLKGYGLNDKPKFRITSEKENYRVNTISYNPVLFTEGNYVLLIEMKEARSDVTSEDITGITPIYFEYNNAEISLKEKKELDKIIKLLNENANLEIEISSHTDCRGGSLYNLRLSNKRAKVTADYIKAGISNPERITAKGYGETKPVNDCDCDEKGRTCSEDEHRENRRTEFKIIKK